MASQGLQASTLVPPAIIAMLLLPRNQFSWELPFDDALITDVATVISTEARAFNNAGRTGLGFWTPNINPFKDPRWDRGQGTLMLM